MMIGKRISGRYKIIEMIGGGGMANVYLAHDIILDRDVAVKMLRLDFVDNEEFIRRFHREAQSATSLAHPNIVNIYDVGEEDSIYYIVMEYVDGQTLKQYIHHHFPIKVEEALQIMEQLTSAISHAHHHHIIHRDIKPQNILIDREGNVKITDFGIAMALSATSITQTNSVIGSVHYLSPEQARGGMATKKSDIYSLGIVMFELLTGRLPFSGESAISIALKHLQSETPSLRRWNPSIPQSVENIVLKATAKDPFYRYDNVNEMAEDIRTSLEPERLYEEKFVIPADEEETKALPVITNDREYKNLEETRLRGKKEPAPDNGASNKPQNSTKKKNKKLPIILVSILAALVILGVLAVTIPILLAPDDVEVPEVANMSIEDAANELETAGFNVGEVIEINDEEVEEGLVVKTDPGAGSTRKEGSTVDLYQSIGKEAFVLDDYTGRQYDDIVRILDDENFQDITMTEVFDEEAAAGTILEQNISEGEEVVPEETELEFTVSKGPEMVSVRDITEYNLTAAQQYAASVGLEVEVTGEEFHDTIEEGLVISQSPVEGTEVRKGTTLSIVLSKGKEELPPKTVFEDITIPYDPEEGEEGNPQEVLIYVEDAENSMTEPFDSFTITEDTKRRIELTIPPDEQAGYKVIRDNTVIIDKVVRYNEVD
ncbi:Stk1 family PASTA domain-containing Ser/Thr kinase [Bacillaceae bacterium Marseille-Q3522]|nr:Stk1 family PASTA domain-containing Ser/Thr kinase [Bacillaceae bacterium Marseille-Q3522]